MILSVSALFHVALFAQIYIWTDENGVKHCSSTPPPNQSTAKQYKEVESFSEGSKESQRSSGFNQPSVTEKTKSKEYPKVVMYSTSWCGYCKKAKAWLQSHKIPFTEYDIEASKAYHRDYKAQGGTGGVPLIIVGEEKMKGWSEEHMKQLLGMTD